MLALTLSLFMAFSVLSFGATEPWARAVCEVSLFGVAAAICARGGGLLRRPAHLTAPALFVLALIAVGAVQLLPLPMSAWRGLGDERGTISAEALEAERLLRSDLYRRDPVTGEVGRADAVGPFTPGEAALRPATFTPERTLSALLALLAAGVLVLCLDRLGADLGGLRGLAVTTGALGIVVAVAASANFQSETSKIMGLRESRFAGGAFGPFVNENHGMSFVNLAFSLLYYLAYQKFQRPSAWPNKLGLCVATAGLASFHALLLALRGGGGGYWVILLFPLAIAAHALRKRPGLVATAAGATGMAAGVLLFIALHFRFTNLHGRLGVWANALKQDHWVLGNGLASFRDRFPSVVTDLPPQQYLLWIYPENEYLQLFFEAGLPGFLLGLGALAYIAFLGWRSLLAQGGTFLLVPGLWGEALHAATDFQFHIWPVATAYLLLIAIMTTSMARHRSEGFHRSSGGDSGTGKIRRHTWPPLGQIPPGSAQ